MDVVSNNYMPGDPRLIDHIVYELKAQGIFDNFRKECIADVDTKPAYQNLRQRVEGSVIGFLKTQQWRPDMNKNQVREMLRKNISESGFLETGVERIVDQVVNPKINTIFLPQVENVVYKVLGIRKPSTFDELIAERAPKPLDTNDRLDMSGNNLLPSDLEAVSPESEPHEKKLDVSNESQKFESNRMDEDESPPFEPLEESTSFMVHEENSVDSHLSGFSGLASHDSNHSFDVGSKLTPMEISNQDSQFSKQSSDDRLSIVMSDETETKIEPNEDSSHSKISKTTDSNSKSFDFLQDNQTNSDKNSQSCFKQDRNDISKKIEDKAKNDEKKTEKHRGSDKHKPRHDSKSESRDRKNEKEKKSDRDKKEHRDKGKYGSKDGKDKRDGKSRSESEGKPDREHKNEKDRDRSKSSSSKHASSKVKGSSKKDSTEIKTKESESKDPKPKDSEYKESKAKESKAKEKNERSRSRDDSKSRSDSKSHSSTKSKGDPKNHSKHNGKSKGDSSDLDKNPSKSGKKDEKPKKDDKHQSRCEKYSSAKKDEKRGDKDKKGPKKDIKKMSSKDDHYALKGKNSNRRSTDRDSSDGHSGTHSSSSSFAESSSSSQLQKAAQDGPAVNSGSNSGDSGNSDQADGGVVPTETSSAPEVQVNTPIILEEVATELAPIQQLPQVKLIKPKFASNIFEARRLMKIRRKLGKIEKQTQMGLIKTGVALKNPVVTTESILTYEIVTVPEELAADDGLRRRPNILKKPLASKNSNRGPKTTAAFGRNKTKSNHHKKTNEHRKSASKIRAMPERKAESEEENVAEVVEVGDADEIISSQHSVISKESWDAVEAKLLENVMKVECHSYANALDKGVVSAVQAARDGEAMEDGDCLGLSREVSLKTQRYLAAVHMLMGRLEDSIVTKEGLLSRPCAPKKTLPTNADRGINRRLPKVAIVDVTSDSEIIISPRKGVKRRACDHPDVHNNNNKTNARSEEDQLNERLNRTVSKVNPSTKPTVPSKAKKAKAVDSTVNHLDTFNLPLSPAESDKSFTTTSEKRNEKDDPRVKRNSSINRAANNSCNQRYSTDDLYKPRLQFSSSRRRAAKSRETN